MERVPSSPEWNELIAAHDEALTAQIRHTDLPLMGLAGAAPQPAMIGESTGFDRVLYSLTLSYGNLDADGPLVLVETARRDTQYGVHSLHYLLEVELDRADADASVSAVEEGALVFDGQRHPATVQRAGSRFWAARCPYSDCVVTVVARDWELASTRLAPVIDVEPLLLTRTAVIAALRARGPDAEPEPVDVENPHRALVDAVLHDSRHIRQRSGQGLAPRRRDMRVTAGLWSAATEAQMRLTDQARPGANAAVTSMVNQLSSLQEEADWFSTDDRLREAAITETLLYGVRLREAVPSQTAQECWARLWHHQQQPIQPERILTDRQDWLQAWNTWAQEHHDDTHG